MFVFVNFVCVTHIYFNFTQHVNKCLQYLFYSLLSLHRVRVYIHADGMCEGAVYNVINPLRQKHKQVRLELNPLPKAETLERNPLRQNHIM